MAGAGVRLLVDTHLLLWSLTDDPKLSPAARELLTAPTNTVVVSHVVLWEVAVKKALKRYAADFPFSPQQVQAELDLLAIEWLTITDRHLFALADLPLIHGDPFDRLLVAQALSEPMRLLTHDRRLAAYTDTVIVV